MRPNWVAVKIRARKRKIASRVYRDFVVDLGLVEGKRRTRSFSSREDAERFLEEKKTLRRQHGDSALALAPETALRYAAIEERLARAGATIEQAADFYVAHHRPVKERLTMGEVLDRCVLEKELQGLAPSYLATFRCSCGSFVGARREVDVSDVTRDAVKAWVLGNGWSPKTQRGYLGDVRALFAWAVNEGFLASSPLDPPPGTTGRRRPVIALAKMIEKEPEIFSPEQIARLFATACTKHELGVDRETGARGQVRVYRRLLGYLALATFAGIRPHELTRLEVAAVDLDGRQVALDGKVTKTSDRRVVELSENCVAWFAQWRAEFPEFNLVAPPSWDRLMKGLRKAAGLTPWPHDVLRHCFASYYHAAHGDKAKLQAMMGHSAQQDTLERHYRAVRTPDGRALTKALTAKFWSIVPPG